MAVVSSEIEHDSTVRGSSKKVILEISYIINKEHSDFHQTRMDPRVYLAKLCCHIKDSCDKGNITVEQRGTHVYSIVLDDTLDPHKQEISELSEEAQRREQLSKRLESMEEIIEQLSGKLKAEETLKTCQFSTAKEHGSGYHTGSMQSDFRSEEKTVDCGMHSVITEEFSPDLVDEIIDEEGLARDGGGPCSKIYQLFQSKIDEWNRRKELTVDGKPLFIVKMLEYVKSKNPWDLIAAQHLFKHRRELAANARYLGENALHWCAGYPCLSLMLYWLLKDGSIDVNEATADGGGATAFQMAAANDNIAFVRLILVNEKLDKNKRDDLGYTALMKAVYWNHPAMVKILVQSGCDQSIATMDGETPRSWALKKGYSQVLRALEGSRL